ncbi:MAG: hypothetical protein ACO1QB_05490 [Verrucomicrobiales bacterium]
MLDLQSKFILIVGLGFALFLHIVAPASVIAMTAEGGMIENSSNVILGLAVILAGIKLWRTRSLPWLSAAMVCLWMYMRELDYQRQFTSRSVESLRFFSSGSISVSSKIAVICILLPFTIAGIHLALIAFKNFRAHPPLQQKWVIYAAQAIGLALLAMALEKLQIDALHIGEEICELMFAAFTLLIVWHLYRRVHSTSNALPELFPSEQSRLKTSLS